MNQPPQSRLPALLTSRDAGGLDQPELPCQQNADKKRNRQSNPKRQRINHFFTTRLRTVLVPEHEKQGHAEAGDDGDKSKHKQGLHGGNYQVSQRLRFWLVSGAALLALAITLALGRWQLSRAAQKEAWHSSMQAQGALPTLDATALGTNPDWSSLLHRKVNLRGHWLTAHTVFLDNRPMNGRAGWYVLTPLQIDASDAVVVVQRGWVARDFLQRTRLPPVGTSTDLVKIYGRIEAPPGRLYSFTSAESGALRQNLNLAAFAVELGRPLLPVSVQQLGAASDGLLRDWPTIEAGVEKHYGYAFQWFGLSALIIALYVWFQIVKRFVKRQQPGPAANS